MFRLVYKQSDHFDRPLTHFTASSLILMFLSLTYLMISLIFKFDVLAYYLGIFFVKKYIVILDYFILFLFLMIYLVQYSSQYLGFHCEMNTPPSTSGLGCITRPTH